MAHSTLYMRNPHTGLMREAPVGFSWTSFFFGPIPPLFRQDWITAIVIFVLIFALSFFGLNFVLWILQGFFYNKYYLEKLIKEGYQVERWDGRPLAELERNTGMRLQVLNSSDQ